MGYVIRPGDVVKSRTHTYSVLKEMNKGGFADAYKAQDESGNVVFFKQYKSPSKLVPWFKSYFKYEDELNKRLRDDPVLKSASIYANEVFLGKAYKSDGVTLWTRNDSIFQVFPFVSGNMTLEDMIKKDFKEYDWEKRLYACAVFAFAMRKLHDADVIHCDLKPENVQIRYDPTIAIKYRPLLIDMDWAILSDKTAPWNGYQGYVGTVGYNSPEHLRGEIPLEVSDVFTSAIMLCQVLAGVHPFGSHLGEDDLTEYVLSGTNDFTKKGKIPFKGYVTPKFEELVLKALDVDPKKRPIMADLHAELMTMCKNHGKPDTSTDPNYSVFNGIKKVVSIFAGKKNEPTPESNPFGGHVAKTPAPATPVKKPVHRSRPTDASLVSGKSRSDETKLIVTGDCGTFATKTSFVFDQSTLRRISSQARFADVHNQFIVTTDGSTWKIKANENAANVTTLDGAVMTDREYALTGSAMVALRGRASGKTAMEIKLSVVKGS